MSTKFNPLDPITGFFLLSLVEVIAVFKKVKDVIKLQTNKKTDSRPSYQNAQVS